VQFSLAILEGFLPLQQYLPVNRVAIIIWLLPTANQIFHTMIAAVSLIACNAYFRKMVRLI